MSSSSTDHADQSGWSASLYNKTASFVYSSEYTRPVLELLAAQPGERIIDFGCGSGEITLQLQKHVASAPGGVVVGTDFSESMIAKAKQNGVKHAFVGDAQTLELPNEFSGIDQKFDAVFSNAALHWCNRDPAGVLESAKKVLKPGGRIAAEMGGFLNCVDEEAKEIIDEVETICIEDCRDKSGKWALMYNRLRFQAVLS
ncbi:hypothetical protein DXG01_001325 [Tephrocybe rancida]|nr:hypothetical protein DXG01_001325 [Tephrocybe rancida]